MSDESTAGYVNWDSFYVGSMLQNNEYLYVATMYVVKGASNLDEAAAKIKERWDGYDWASTSLDLSKVDWKDVAEAFFEESKE